ncbi:related to DNA repair protein RAD10 [Saccharomycodes ludwigii]|uniref:Related to DNA repair protein RAD10 n=1 Tax=Saccharomycodes ludwigii TaxID=36035 RepID=A0A376B6H3_9ASCO|nr:related to DNA repair protein RAD10 [Saccharomycodes ludwigii]
MDNSDTTSFKSILANAKKLQNNAESIDIQENGKKLPVIYKEQSHNHSDQKHSNSSNNTVVNAFTIKHNQPQLNDKNDDIQSNGTSGGDKYSNTKTVLVSKTQKGNPLLDKLQNTKWRYVSSSPTAKIEYDYLIRGSRKVIFLSLKYHKLHPEYIYRKIKPIVNQNSILLCVVDVENSEDILKDLTKLTLFNGFTLLLSFNFEQAAKYIMFLNK